MRIAKISTSGITIASMLHGYSGIRRTIGFFLETAEVLVILASTYCMYRILQGSVVTHTVLVWLTIAYVHQLLISYSAQCRKL